MVVLDHLHPSFSHLDAAALFRHVEDFLVRFPDATLAFRRRVAGAEVLPQEGESLKERCDCRFLRSKFHSQLLQHLCCCSQGLGCVPGFFEGDHEVVGVSHHRKSRIHQCLVQGDQRQVREQR